MKERERCNVKLKVSSGEGPTRPRFVDVPSAQGRWRWRRTVLEVLRVWDRGELWSFMAGCRVGMVWGEHGVGQPETTVLSQSFSPRPDTQSRAHFSSSRWESELSVSFFFSLRSRLWLESSSSGCHARLTPADSSCCRDYSFPFQRDATTRGPLWWVLSLLSNFLFLCVLVLIKTFDNVA